MSNKKNIVKLVCNKCGKEQKPIKDKRNKN